MCPDNGAHPRPDIYHQGIFYCGEAVDRKSLIMGEGTRLCREKSQFLPRILPMHIPMRVDADGWIMLRLSMRFSHVLVRLFWCFLR